MGTKKILVVGSLVEDLISQTIRFPSSGETVVGAGFSKAPGGKGANQAVQAARLGLPVDFFGMTGDDGFSRELVTAVRASGVDTSEIGRRDNCSSGASGVSIETIDGIKCNRIIMNPGANFRITVDDVRFLEERIEDYACLILQFEIPIEVNEYLAQLAHDHGVVVIVNPAPSQPMKDDFLRVVDYLTPNEHEASDLTGIKINNLGKKADDNDITKCSDFLLHKGVKNVLITLGGAGSVLINEKERIVNPAIEGHHADKYEMTKIPTGVFDLNGVYYMFYFSKYSWNVPSATSMNYGGAVKSVDHGQTWERVYDLTWTDHSVDDAGKEQAEVSDIQTLINEDVDLNPGVGSIDVAEHLGYRFTEITPYEAKDGYVYLFGQGGYRSSWISLARVPVADFEVFSEYQYLTGYDEAGNPAWLKGREGLNYLGSHPEEGYCLEATASEMTFMYSPALKRYLIVMASSSSGSWGAHYFTSETVAGPYNVHGTMILPSSSPLLPQSSLYAPMVSEAWTEDGGYVFYMLISTWMPNYNPNLFRVEFN